MAMESGTLMTHNRGYKVAEFFPNFFFIGSDGGGEAYAFDISGDDVNKRSRRRIVSIGGRCTRY